jgi:hypothetical protein
MTDQQRMLDLALEHAECCLTVAIAYKRQLTEAEANIVRLKMALTLARTWSMGDGYSATVTAALRDWIDGGMAGPIPAEALRRPGSVQCD